MPAHPGVTRPLSRLYGIVLLMALAALAVGLRQRTYARAERISASEAAAAASFAEVAAALRQDISVADPPAVQLSQLGRQRGLRLIPGTGDDLSVFAEGELYVYGLGLTTSSVDPKTGRLRSGWVLRAWPRVFGVTGDVEFHADDQGELWHGHNEVGRSGTTEGFPPKFPAKEIGQPRQAIWWHPSP